MMTQLTWKQSCSVNRQVGTVFGLTQLMLIGELIGEYTECSCVYSLWTRVKDPERKRSSLWLTCTQSVLSASVTEIKPMCYLTVLLV